MCSIYFWILVVLVVLMQLHLPNRGLSISQHSHCGEGLLSARQSSHHAALAGASCTVQSGKKEMAEMAAVIFATNTIPSTSKLEAS